MAFSLRERPALVDRLRSGVFDLLVVGGGVTGAGVLRDAALRGLKVALVERGDFACGTSSRSSKLVHGGLRYLEMGDVALVFEAVRERQRLMKLAPHLARPQAFLLPVFRPRRRHSIFALDIGLTLYDMLAAFAGVLRHKAVRARGLRKMEPLLKRDDLQGGVRYYDAMTDDARLVLANVRDGVEAGGVAVSRVSFVEPQFRQGRFVSALVKDEWTGDMMRVAAHGLVLAGGPWTDDLRGRIGAKAELRALRPSKGVHIVVTRDRLPLSQAVMMTAADGRIVFALPWSHATVLGTTDTPWDGPPDDPPTTLEDARYLLDTANAHFDPPGGPLAPTDVVSSWGGIRPLVAADSSSTYNASREHLVATDPRGIVTISGGKLTTYRVMAEEALDAAISLLPPGRAAAAQPGRTQTLPLPGARTIAGRHRALEEVATRLHDQHGIDPALATLLAQRYGDEAAAVVALAREEPDGLVPVVAGAPVVWGELRWAAQHEMALSLVDAAVRRTPLYYTVGVRLHDCADEIARRFCGWLGLPADRAPELAIELRQHIDRHAILARETPHAA
ncbi:MAG: glycerol-3-phosphate dehydrogenase/oxidase [Myxococcales bacterium]|nr:glycerol-3-phosphate dehydrogenase/oxidase [Myxococcales bacterium]